MTCLHRRGSRLTDGDAVAHLQYVRRLYETDGKSVSLRHRYLLDSEDYPTGFHRLLYLLRVPSSFLERFGGFLPTLFDLGLLTLFWVAMQRWGGVHHEWILLFPLMRLWIGNVGRASHFSERAFGVLWGNLFLFCLMVALEDASLFWGAAAMASFCVVVVSSKFGWQGTVLVMAMLSVVTLNPSYILGVGVASVVSFLVTRGASLRVLKGLIRHSIWYRSYLAPRNPAVKRHYGELLDWFRSPNLKRGVWLSLHNSVLKTVTDNPLHLLLPFVWAGDLFSYWALAGVLLCLVIATEPLKFLGEPERYLEFTAFPMFIMASSCSMTTFAGVVAITCSLGIFALHWFLLIRQKQAVDGKEEDLLALQEVVSKIEESTILSLPMRTSFFMGLHSPKHRYVTLFANIGEGETQQRYNELMPDRYPYPGQDLTRYVGQYGVNYLVVDEEALLPLDDCYYDFSGFSLFERAGRYTVYAT